MKRVWLSLIALVVVLWVLGAGVAFVNGFNQIVSVGIIGAAGAYGGISYLMVTDSEESSQEAKMAFGFVIVLGVVVGVGMIGVFEFEMYELVEQLLDDGNKPNPCPITENKTVTCV